MKDILLDIVKHTVPIGVFESLRIDGTATETKISSKDEQQLVVLMAKTNSPVSEFNGMFGIPNLSLLNTILNIPEYSQGKHTQITVESKTSDGKSEPKLIKFENDDFKNEFRLIAGNIIDKLLPTLTMSATKWPISFVPSDLGQTRLKYQTSANPTETAVTFRVEDGVVKATVGDVSGHSGNFIFHSGVKSKEDCTAIVPLAIINSILALQGDKEIKMGQLGMMVSVNSGLCVYDYIIPMLSK